MTELDPFANNDATRKTPNAATPKAAEPPEAGAPDPPAKSGKRGSVPSFGEVLEPPHEPSLTFTLSEIFGQHRSASRAEAVPNTAQPTTAPVRVEDPAVADAMARGEKLLPDAMKTFGDEIRRALASLLPVSFETLANFGADHLVKVAELVGHVSTLTDALHQVDAAREIGEIAEQAKQMNEKPSLLDRVGIHDRFDPATANVEAAEIRARLTTELYPVRKAAIDLERAMIPLNTAISVMRILADMTKQDDLAALVARRAELFTSSLAEAKVAKKQVENLEKLAEECILQCDELTTVTLPAIKFRNSL